MQRRLGNWWAAAATVTLLGAAAWMRATEVGAPDSLHSASVALLIAVLVSSVGGAVLSARPPRRWPRIAFCAVAIGFVVVAGDAERTRLRAAADPEAARVDVVQKGTAAMVEALNAEMAALQKLAAEALDAPADADAAFAHLDRKRGKVPTRAVALVRGDRPVAWSGRLVAPVDSLVGPVGAVGSPFYLSLFALAGRDTDRAIAESLVHVEAPADALAESIDEAVSRRFDVAGFAYRGPEVVAADSFVVITSGGVPILGVRAVAPSAEILSIRSMERGRTRAGFALALALGLFLASTWRSGRAVTTRFGALAVALAVITIVPLTSFSNVSPVFNPAFYYVAKGGPFTGSIGSLALSSALVLLGLLAAMRARVATKSRAAALIAVLAIAGIGPIVLGDLARGIQVPQSGVTATLWLAWEGTIFLAAVTVLIAGVAAGRLALGTRRGVPLWVAPTIAAAASALVPSLMQAPGAFPAWYPALWVVAIGALALGRRERGAIAASAIVAACGAVTLVWGQSVRARVQLAERDVAGLTTVDQNASELLRRFIVQLDPAAAPRSKVELLARYAASNLASGDYPVEFTSWDPAGNLIADLRVSLASGAPTGLTELAHAAMADGRPTLREVPGTPGTHLMLSVPHLDRSLTTVVVAPRSRLVARDPFGALIGLPGPPTNEPPYSLRLDSVDVGADAGEAARWVRRVNELHGDWYLPRVDGKISRVHATVDLRSYGVLATRGALMVLYNLVILALLWSLLLVADGAFGRWLRMRRRRWRRSYRAQLTVALLTFFVLPAGAFAIWSYRRLQSDDQQARDLLVREMLRGVVTSTDSLPAIGQRFETPLFLYANGVLAQASDPLLEALAPIGRLLTPSASRTLRNGEDPTAAAEEMVGDAPVRFGFRAGAERLGVRFVMVAPARTDDLALDRRRRDLGIFVLFATALGGLAALWLSGLAARQFSRPIRELQQGALALAAGEREPVLESDPPVEFQPVFTAFRQMARDLEAGREQEARAQRVLAWGEMARQVAHEIKNPLTPMRLGMQHLLRARRDTRVDFDQVLQDNVERVLAEISRLDEIARAFSRYGTAPEQRAAAEAVDVAQIVTNVVQLEQLGADEVTWSADVPESAVWAMARSTELREVLLNLLENSRLAAARTVRVHVTATDEAVSISVADDGQGIAADVLPKIFEPHFSTRTSGSGLGLAISRRLLEGWGGAIGVESATTTGATGTTVRITLVPSPPR